jgi:hypothetical protein
MTEEARPKRQKRPFGTYQTRHDKILTRKMVSQWPRFVEMETLLDQVTSALSLSAGSRRNRTKGYLIDLATEIGKPRGIDVGRIQTRSKAACVCWFCEHCPEFCDLGWERVARSAIDLLHPHRREAADRVLREKALAEQIAKLDPRALLNPRPPPPLARVDLLLTELGELLTRSEATPMRGRIGHGVPMRIDVS